MGPARIARPANRFVNGGHHADRLSSPASRASRVVSAPTALVVGVGAERGLGAALCRRFAAEGCHVLVAGRTPAKIEQVVRTIAAAGGSAEPVPTDTTREADVIRLFDRAMAPGRGRDPVDLVASNAGNNRRLDFREVSAETFEDFWRVGCLGGFLVGREAARRLVPLGRGTVIFTGASASLRGKPGFAHFAAAKAGLRMIAQSMAREYGPLGLHVAHVVIDGGIDGDRLRSRAPNIAEERGPDGLLDIDAIAEAYWHIHRQHRSAWTQELDLRTYKESF
jgi:NAD(P)-dependent dehydrogenase (short-subunit alcohol dehydrogenase family)